MSLASPELPPVVLSFATSDATCGGGLQSDVLTLASMGCHPLSVLAAVTVRDTRGVDELLALDSDAVAAQARALLEDIPVQAFKMGMVGSVENVAVIAEILSDYPGIPLVLEPALAFIDGDEAAGEDMICALAELVLPQVTVLVGSRSEVHLLAMAAAEGHRGADDSDDDAEDEDLEDFGDFSADMGGDDETGEAGMSLDDAIARLFARGVGYVLLTGASEAGPQVVNILIGPDGVVRTDAWERLPGRFLGAGATLAGALAAALAHGMEVPEAAREAQEFTWQALSGGYRPGMGMAVPDRLFWARPADVEDTDVGR